MIPIGITRPQANSNSADNDKIIDFKGLSLAGNNLTFIEDSVFSIGGSTYTNPNNVVVFIPFTPPGFRRNDIFVFTTSNTFIRVAGPLSAGNLPVVAPATPNNTVYVTLVTVTENSVSDPAPVFNSGIFRKKIEKGAQLRSTNSSTDIVIIQEETTYRFMGTQTTLRKFFNNPFNSQLYDGRDHTLICDQDDDDLTVKHNSNAYPGNVLGIPYWFADEQDLVLTKGDIAKFSYSLYRNRMELVSLNGKSHTHTIADISGLQAALDAKQDLLISGINIKTFNGESLLGSGNISVPVMPPPYLENLIPDSNQPSTTGNFVLQGSFFTPNMTVVVEGQTLNYKTFVSDNEVILNLTTGAAEGTFDITLNNGVQAVFSDALLIVLGEVFEPLPGDWINVSGQIDLATAGDAKTVVLNSNGYAEWDKTFDISKDISIRFTDVRSPLGFVTNGQDLINYSLQLYDKVTGLRVIDFTRNYQTTDNLGGTYIYSNGAYDFARSFVNWKDLPNGVNNELRIINGVIFYYENGILRKTFGFTQTNNLGLKVRVRRLDLINIKYIELA